MHRDAKNKINASSTSGLKLNSAIFIRLILAMFLAPFQNSKIFKAIFFSSQTLNDPFSSKIQSKKSSDVVHKKQRAMPVLTEAPSIASEGSFRTPSRMPN